MFQHRKDSLDVDPITELDLQFACQDLQSQRAVQTPTPDGL